MRKKFYGVLGAIILSASILSGCGNSGVSQEDYNALNATCESLESSLKDAESQNNSLSVELESVNDELNTAISERDSAISERDTVQSEYEAYKALMSPYESMAVAGAESSQKDVYTLGEPWIVNGQWSLTINSVTTTADRNQFSDKSPAQVVIIDYTYENLGYTGMLQDLYISASSFSVIDQIGEMAYTYPASTAGYATPTPVGAKCVGAQEAFGLNNESSSITLIVEDYGSDGNRYEATFELTVQ